jgi:hypothetical protein
MDRDGSDQHRFPLGTQVTWPAWSPTGNEIAIGPVPAAIRPDGTGKHALTSNGGSGDGLDWAALAGTTTEPVPPVGIRTEALPDPSTKTNTTVAATTIWPTKDGYRDTVRILQRMYEPAKATMDIFGPSGARVRRVTYHFDTGWVAYNWNGRSSTGVILPSGRYRIVTTSRDLAGNVRVLTRYVLLYRGYH